MAQNETIGSNIKLYRNKLGLTQELLAEYLSVPRESISYYENGQRQVPMEILSKTAKLFCLDEYDLFEEDLESKDVKVALAFRADTMNSDDLNNIADFKKIILNYLNMKKAYNEPVCP